MNHRAPDFIALDPSGDWMIQIKERDDKMLSDSKMGILFSLLPLFVSSSSCLAPFTPRLKGPKNAEWRERTNVEEKRKERKKVITIKSTRRENVEEWKKM